MTPNMVTLSCKNCKLAFKVDNYRATKAQYCSSLCYGEAAKNGVRQPTRYWLGKKHPTKYWLGKKRDSATIEKLRTAQLGREPWNKGGVFPQVEGERNVNWKGDKVGYHALHSWVSRKRGKPSICEHCKKTGLKGWQIHWANKSHEYKRDLSDWLRLCVPCHKQYDQSNLTYS